jgi:hypothetical protein
MPSGQHPFNELLKGTRRRSKGSLNEALRECWLIVRVCGAARDAAMETDDIDEVHRFSSLGLNALHAYAKLYPLVEFEARLKVLEEKLHAIE